MNLKETKRLGMNTRFVFSAPKWWVSALCILLFPVLFSAVLGGDLFPAIIFLSLPAYLSAIFSVILARMMKVRYWLKTEMFLSLFYVVLVVGILTLSIFLLYLMYFIHELFSINFVKVTALSLSIPLWLRWTYIASIITTERRKAMVLTLTYPFSQILAIILGYWIFFNTASFSGLFMELIMFYLLFSSVSVIFAFIFTETMDRPLKRVLGVGGLEFTRWALEHYKERTDLGKKRLEGIFRSFGKDAVIDTDALSLWKNGKLSGIVAIHTAHMGPFGEVGGSNMPEKLSKMLGCENFMSPHGASTHEMNPVDENEVRRIAEAIEHSIKNSEEVFISKSIRLDGKVKVLAQRFGDWLLIVESSHPDGTEDIDPSVAKVLEEKIKIYGYKGLIFIDAHNCSMESAEETFVYSERYTYLEREVLKAAEMLKDAELYRAKAGIGRFRGLGMEHGIGPMGIQSLVVEVDGQKTAYVIVDGNNMVRGLRDKIIGALSDLADNVEVMTTDNHYVNRVYGGSNPVGLKGRDEIIAACKEAVKDAVKGMGDVRVKHGNKSTKLRVFGHGTPAKLVAVPESVAAMGKILAFLNLFSMLLMDLLLAILI